MDICASDTSWNLFELHGRSLNFQMRLKNLLFPVSTESVTARLQTSESFPTEAACMIMLMAIFVILALMGTLITAYEFFYERKTQEKDATYESISDNLKELRWKISSSFKVWSKYMKSFLKCFCIVKNGRKILDLESSKEQFGCLQGIRFVGCIWSILLHISFFYVLTLRNMDNLKPWVGSWVIHLFSNSMFVIDVFFVLSGFLNAYTFSKDYMKNSGRISILFFYIKRFVRITPPYMMVLGFYTVLLSYTWSSSEGLPFATNLICQENWWWHLLYINNFQSTTQQCMLWCWYLATEMQFYIVSPIFMISLLKHPAIGYGFTSVCIFLSCFASFIITKHCNLLDGFPRLLLHIDNLAPKFYRASLYYEKVYVMPHTRIQSYLVGILLGIYIQKRRNSGKDTKSNWVSSTESFPGRFSSCFLNSLIVPT